jgi:hypothetical protein
MKKFYLIIAALLCLQGLSAQFAINGYYVNNILNMEPSPSSGNGVGMEVFFGPRHQNFSGGFAFSRSSYGSKTEAIKFNSYGYEVNTNLRINNDFTNISLYSRYKLGKLNNFITPFVEGKFGWGFLSTRLNIEQSMDMGGCEPVYPNTVHQDGTWIGYAGGGLDLKLNGLIRRDKPERNLSAYLSLAAGYNYGGKLTYFNAEHADKTSGHQHSDKEDYNATFIDTQTQQLHEHTIGTLQTAHLSMAEFKLGIGFRF